MSFGVIIAVGSLLYLQVNKQTGYSTEILLFCLFVTVENTFSKQNKH